MPPRKKLAVRPKPKRAAPSAGDLCQVLPDAIVQEILGYLPPAALLCVGTTCRALRAPVRELRHQLNHRMLQRAEVGEVVETMDAWGGTGDVSLSCASRLSYLAFNDKEGREALVCALEPIVRLMMRCTRRHWVEALPADPKVQAHCCSALGSISSGSTERSLSAVRAGGVKAIVNAMRSHPADREVQFQGAAAMYRIVHDDTAQGRERKLAAGIAGGVEAALAAMQGNPRDTELLRWGAMAFRSIARGDLETTGRAINAGAFEITEAAKAAHPNNASVQQHCDEALNLLRWARDRLPPAGV